MCLSSFFTTRLSFLSRSASRGVPAGCTNLLLAEHVGDRLKVETELTHDRPGHVPQAVDGDVHSHKTLAAERSKKLKHRGTEPVAPPRLALGVYQHRSQA